eukprot:GILJ01009118.1.p1 GENE.GILJ01009118.1~~GILJ01009118.1.p1  ORF type:complete len:229 (-),score=18.45 GILJ01009118.1:145-831(-)
MWLRSLLFVLVSVWISLCHCRKPDIPELLPTQFTATIAIISHLLPPETTYPPPRTDMIVHYDWMNKRVRADILAGRDANRTYIRRYDEKYEVMMRKAGPSIPEHCVYSALRERMPNPEFPWNHDFEYDGTQTVEGQPCDCWTEKHMDRSIVTYCQTSEGGIPVRVTESIRNGTETRLTASYVFSNFSHGEPSLSLFDIPSKYSPPRSKCSLQSTGFPYLHIFSHYIRF